VITAELFIWDKNYDNKEQVRPYLAEYTALRDAGTFYNDDFKGKIPGVAGSPNEDTAIYLLSNLWRIEGELEEVARAINDGYQALPSGDPGGFKRYAKVIVYRPGHYSGGTGMISRYESARVAFDVDGTPFAVIPKGKRHGHQVGRGQVLVKS
jgi:hypothetical protein